MVKQQKQGCEMWQQMYQMRMGQDAWPVQQNPTRIVGSGGRAAVYGGGGAAAKRGCAGTGVFLPRRYGNSNNNDCNAYSSDSRKRPGIFYLEIILDFVLNEIRSCVKFNFFVIRFSLLENTLGCNFDCNII